MKLSHLKYGFLISATTLFGAGNVRLYAQDNAKNPQKIESKAIYKKHFMQSISPEKPTISVDFMVDSIKDKTSNGNLLADINVIQLFADLDDEEYDEYLDIVHNKIAAAHEMWHRICLMNGVLEKPMSATHFRTGQDNFEITANIVALLTFRDIYLSATPEQRIKLHRIDDPKIQMYLLAVDHDIIRPLSKDKKDFDFEMKFIAQSVSSFWNNTMSSSYADYHNTLTVNSGRKEMTSPVYEQNFNHDIKLMNTIGGIDFSQYYDFKTIHNRREFPKGQQPDERILSRSLDEPNYEAWINEKSQLKRFSKQHLDLPNFAAPHLANEKAKRLSSERVQPYTVLPQTSGYKAYPKMNTMFFAAIELKKGTETFKFYPCGAIDKIRKVDDKGRAFITTYYFDGSFEKGELYKGRKNGTFVYYDNTKKEAARCVFKNGRAVDGIMLFPFSNTLFSYPYKNGKLQSVEKKKLSKKMNISYLFKAKKTNHNPLAQNFSFNDLPAPKTPKLIKFEPVYREVPDVPQKTPRKKRLPLMTLKQKKR